MYIYWRETTPLGARSWQLAGNHALVANPIGGKPRREEHVQMWNFCKADWNFAACGRDEEKKN